MNPTKEQIRDYILPARAYPLVNVDQLISMVILHFDIPDKRAGQMVREALRKTDMNNEEGHEPMWEGPGVPYSPGDE